MTGTLVEVSVFKPYGYYVKFWFPTTNRGDAAIMGIKEMECECEFLNYVTTNLMAKEEAQKYRNILVMEESDNDDHMGS